MVCLIYGMIVVCHSDIWNDCGLSDIWNDCGLSLTCEMIWFVILIFRMIVVCHFDIWNDCGLLL